MHRILNQNVYFPNTDVNIKQAAISSSLNSFQF